MRSGQSSRSSSSNRARLSKWVTHVELERGSPATHPLTGRELRALRRHQREAGPSPFVFVSERGAPFSVRGFQAIVERAGLAAGFDEKSTHTPCLWLQAG